jgi:hypothetical protein
MNMRSAVARAMILPLTSARATTVRDGELAPLKFDGIKDLAVQWALILLNEFWRASFVERPRLAAVGMFSSETSFFAAAEMAYGLLKNRIAQTGSASPRVVAAQPNDNRSFG